MAHRVFGLLFVCSLGAVPPAFGQDHDVLAEDVVAYLIAVRDMAIFKRTATVHLDGRAVLDLGIATELHKVGPGSFIASMKDGDGFFGFSVRRKDSCHFEERYTLAGRPTSTSPYSEPETPDRVYNFSKATFAIVADESVPQAMRRRWKLEVMGENVLCIGDFCSDATGLSDITAMPDDASPEQKAEELNWAVALFQRKFCPGGAD